MRRAMLMVALVMTGALVVQGSEAFASSADCVELSAQTKFEPGAQHVALIATIKPDTLPPPLRGATDDIGFDGVIILAVQFASAHDGDLAPPQVDLVPADYSDYFLRIDFSPTDHSVPCP